MKKYLLIFLVIFFLLFFTLSTKSYAISVQGNISLYFIALNTPPTIDAVILNSTYGLNLTSENLTAWPINVTDNESDNVNIVYKWYKNGSQLEKYLFTFDILNNSQKKLRDYANGNNGNVVGATLVNGKLGNAYYFDGNSYVEGYYPSYLHFAHTNKFTYEFFVKVDPTSQKGLIFEGMFGNPQILMNGSGLVAFVYSSSIYGWRSSINYIDPSIVNKWTHIAIVGNGTHHILYINGEKKQVVTAPSDIIDRIEETYWIGGRSGYSDLWRFKGYIDELRIYSYPLPENQIKEHNKTLFNRIVSEQTKPGDIWQVEATPNDGKIDGNTIWSNTLKIIAPYNLTINLVSPSNNTVITSTNTIQFKYKVNSTNNLTNCSLIVNNQIKQTTFNPERNTLLTFTQNLANGNYIWKIKCSDDKGNTNTSETRSLIVSVPYCGDGICQEDESCSTCSIDCGSCPSGGGGYTPPQPPTPPTPPTEGPGQPTNEKTETISFTYRGKPVKARVRWTSFVNTTPLEFNKLVFEFNNTCEESNITLKNLQIEISKEAELIIPVYTRKIAGYELKDLLGWTLSNIVKDPSLVKWSLTKEFDEIKCNEVKKAEFKLGKFLSTRENITLDLSLSIANETIVKRKINMKTHVPSFIVLPVEHPENNSVDLYIIINNIWNETAKFNVEFYLNKFKTEKKTSVADYFGPYKIKPEQSLLLAYRFEYKDTLKDYYILKAVLYKDDKKVDDFSYSLDLKE